MQRVLVDQLDLCVIGKNADFVTFFSNCFKLCQKHVDMCVAAQGNHGFEGISDFEILAIKG